MKALNNMIRQIRKNYESNRAHILECYTKPEQARIPAWKAYLDAAENARG